MTTTDDKPDAQAPSIENQQRYVAHLFRAQAARLVSAGVDPQALATAMIGVGIHAALSHQPPEEVACWLRTIADFALDQSKAGCAGSA